MTKDIIYNENCLEGMKRLADNSIDLVLTDPPHGITACKWDSVISLEPMWEQLKRVIKPNGAIVMIANQPFTSILIVSNLKMFKYDWIWRKPKGTGHLNAKKQPMKDKEDICVFYKKQPVYNPQMMQGEPFGKKTGIKQQSGVTGKHGEFRNINNGTRYPKQILDFGVVGRGTLHPTQKPVALMEYLIKTYTNEGEIVLDFAIGSGTTAVACKQSDRHYIGFETNPEYCEIARKRLSKVQLELL